MNNQLGGLTSVLKEFGKMNSFGSPLASQLAEFRDHHRWKNQLGGLGTLTELSKSLASNQNQLKGLGELANKNFQNQHPSTILSLAGKLQNDGLASKWTGIADVLQSSALTSQMNSMQQALGGLSSLITQQSIKRLDLLKDFEEISDGAARISEQIIERESITKGDLEEIKGFLERIEVKVDEKDRDYFSIVLKWMAVLSFILSIIGEARNWIQQEDSVTPQDLNDFKNDLHNHLEEALNRTKEVRIARIACEVRLKPRTKTLVLDTLAECSKVVVIQTQHKWAYINYMSPSDCLSSHGWVLKKHLSLTE